MDPYKVRDMLRKRPFEPFRVHLRDGQTYDIRYPEINGVLKDEFLIGVPAPNRMFPVYKYLVHVPWDDVVRLEPIGSAVPAASASQASS